MADARTELLDCIVDPDSAYDQAAAVLAPARLQAADELFQQRRDQIPLLAQRAEDAGIRRIRDFADLVPLLFAHTAYKSYPMSFYENGRWDRMGQWLNTLSAADVSVDVSGVTNVDEWLDRLWAADHVVISTSGSTGKCSFLNHTRSDRAMKTRHFKYSSGWPFARAQGDRPFFWLGPSRGRTSAVEAFISNAENWGKPGEIHTLFDEPLLISDISAMASLRTRMANGTATPDEIAASEEDAAEKSKKAEERLAKFTETILAYRDQPIFLSGMWAQHMLIIDRARELGVGEGEFHSDSIVAAGGGVKGVSLPPDYMERVDSFYGDVHRFAFYGMTEMAQSMPRCEQGRYHAAPGLIMLPLDEAGERLLTEADAVDGRVEARFGFLDLLYEGRWGGMISGDKVIVDFAETCPCGRAGPTLLDNITRFAQAGQNDHIGCAGTIDAYIRGAVQG